MYARCDQSQYLFVGMYFSFIASYTTLSLLFSTMRVCGSAHWAYLCIESRVDGCGLGKNALFYKSGRVGCRNTILPDYGGGYDLLEYWIDSIYYSIQCLIYDLKIFTPSNF